MSDLRAWEKEELYNGRWTELYPFIDFNYTVGSNIMEMKQRQNRWPKKRGLCFEIAWTDPEDFGKKNWVDRDDVRTVA